MRNEGGEVHSETDEARAGSTPHIVRWILGISLFFAVVLLSAIWIFGALSQGDIEEEANVSNIARDLEENEDIDGVIIDGADQMETAEGEGEATGEDALNMPNETPAELADDVGTETAQ